MSSSKDFGRPESEAFYLQPIGSYSEPQIAGILDVATENDHPERQPSPQEHPILLLPRTYSPAPSPTPRSAKQSQTPSRSAKKPRSPARPARNTHTDVSSSKPGKLSAIQLEKLYEPRQAAGHHISSSARHHARKLEGATWAKENSRDKAKAALGIDSQNLHEEFIRRKQHTIFAKLSPRSALQSHKVSPIDQAHGASVSPLLPATYTTQDGETKPQVQLFAEDYHAMLIDQRNQDIAHSSRRRSFDFAGRNARLIPKPLFWKGSKKQPTNDSSDPSTPASAYTPHSIKSPPYTKSLPPTPQQRRRSSTSALLSPLFHSLFSTQSAPIEAPQGTGPPVPRKLLFAETYNLPPMRKTGLIPGRSHLHSAKALFASSSPKAVAEPAFDYSRPIPRPPPHPERHAQIQAALDKAKEEMAEGVEGARKVFEAIAQKGSPAEKEHPFGLGLHLPRTEQETRRKDGERVERGGRGRFLATMGSSVHRSKSQKRREELKSRIRLVGEIDPHLVGMEGGMPIGHQVAW